MFTCLRPIRYDPSGPMVRTFYHQDCFRSAYSGESSDPSTVKALDHYDEVLQNQELWLRMRLEPGDMQFVSNHLVLHARTAYSDPDRHLLRLWMLTIRPSLWEDWSEWQTRLLETREIVRVTGTFVVAKFRAVFDRNP